MLAALSGGASGTAQLGSASGSAVSAVVQEMVKKPAFWTSFLRTAGPSLSLIHIWWRRDGMPVRRSPAPRVLKPDVGREITPDMTAEELF